jgi:hypothetical protein
MVYNPSDVRYMLVVVFFWFITLCSSADEYVSGLFAKAFATEGMKVIPELIRRKERGPGTQTCSPIRKYVPRG